MAENPATWGRAEKVICEALYRATEAQAAGICGLSTIRQIADALREAGLLKEEVHGEEVQEARVPEVQEAEVRGEAGEGEAGR